MTLQILKSDSVTFTRPSRRVYFWRIGKNQSCRRDWKSGGRIGTPKTQEH
ncbi:hypothetical protein [Kamptonema sp. UHCC 0994]|nr:hypothetical protein [Kamptonema sp. UHCC 0994]MDF0552204.1 hypothetical protein [Kamptonema sp. UHCC 0994]